MQLSETLILSIYRLLFDNHCVYKRNEATTHYQIQLQTFCSRNKKRNTNSGN